MRSLRSLFDSLQHSLSVYISNSATRWQCIYLLAFLVYLALLLLWLLLGHDQGAHGASHYGFLFGWLVLSHALSRWLYNVLALMACTQGLTRLAAFVEHYIGTTAPHTDSTTTHHPPFHHDDPIANSSSHHHHTAIHINSSSITLPPQFNLPKFPYGTQRLEVLARFSLAILCCFICCTLCTESIHSFFSSHQIRLRSVFKVAFIGILLDVLGIVLFRRLARHFPGASNWCWSPMHHEHMSRLSPASSSSFDFSSFSSYSTHATDSLKWLSNSNSHWIWNRQSREFFRRLLCGSFPQMMLIFIGIFIGSNHFSTRCDVICTAVGSLLLAFFQLSELRTAAIILLQTTPPHMQNALSKCMRELSTIDGVLETHSDHFWTLGFNSQLTSVGTLVVRVQEDADETQIATHCREIFSTIVNKLHVQIEKDSFASPTLSRGTESFEIPLSTATPTPGARSPSTHITSMVATARRKPSFGASFGNATDNKSPSS